MNKFKEIVKSILGWSFVAACVMIVVYAFVRPMIDHMRQTMMLLGCLVLMVIIGGFLLICGKLYNRYEDKLTDGLDDKYPVISCIVIFIFCGLIALFVMCFFNFWNDAVLSNFY